MDIQPKSFTQNYETVIVVAPDMSEDDYKKTVKKFLDLIKSNEGSISNIEYWGVRKLAYPIRKRTKGYYAYVEFSSAGSLISKLEQEYLYDERILRYLTVKLNRHALEYNVKRREQGFGMRQNAEVRS